MFSFALPRNCHQIHILKICEPAKHFGNLSNLFSTQVKSIFLLWMNLITKKAGVRVSSNLENMENLKMSGNLKVGPKSQGKSRNFLKMLDCTQNAI